VLLAALLLLLRSFHSAKEELSGSSGVKVKSTGEGGGAGVSEALRACDGVEALNAAATSRPSVLCVKSERRWRGCVAEDIVR